MADLGWFVAGAAAGVLGGVALRRRRAAATAGGADPALLPDPALAWLAGARGALGVWVSQPVVDPEAPLRWFRVIPGDRLTTAAIAAVETRLQALHQAASSGGERVEQGTLLHACAGGLIAALLMPGHATGETLHAVTLDLVALLDGLGRKPMLERVLDEEDGPVESLGSIGLRLAYQLERILHAEVIVAATLEGEVRVIGTSGRADRRLLDTVAQPESPLARVGRGEDQSLTTIADPLGGTVPDRRAHIVPAILLPIRYDAETVGAIVCWTGDDDTPVGPVIAEVQEALRNAGPRILRARKLEELGSAATTDPLTNLANRRGLDDAMRQIGVTSGALIYADLDKFKLLNDTLGHHAGDAALVHFARLVHDQIRGGDTAARIGGEEFAIWLPGAPIMYGAKAADRIRIKLGTTTWDWQGRSWPLGASFGVASVPDTTRSLENLPALADAALMEAKRLGRNRVEVAPPAKGKP